MKKFISARVSARRSLFTAVGFALAALAAPAAMAETSFSRLPFDAMTPYSYAQFAPSGGTLRARVESVPGVALGESDAVAAPAAQTTRAWTSGFGFSSRVGADINGPAYRTNGGGATIGVDRIFSPTFLAGVALSYSRAETTSIGTRSESDTVSGAIYGAWAPAQGWEVEGLLGIDHADIDTSRVLLFGGVPAVTRGETDSFGFSAAANVGYRFRFAAPMGAAFLKPFAGLSYASQDRDDYAEVGAFGPGLVFPSKTFERSTFNLGGAMGIDLNTGNGWIVRPELRAAWSHYLNDPVPPVPALLNGVPVVLQDPKPGRDGAVVGLEVTAITTGFQVFAGYAGDFRDNATAHQGRLGIRFTW